MKKGRYRCLRYIVRCIGHHLTKVGSIDLCLCNLWSLRCYSVAVLVIHPFLFVQTLKDKTHHLKPKSHLN